MKAYVLTGGGIDGIEARSIPEPRPGPGDVLVAVRATSLNFRDASIAERGVSGRIPLSDAAGEVIAVGEGVIDPVVGDRVATCFSAQWIDGPITQAAYDSALGGAIDGVLAERVVLPASAVVRMPSGWTYEQAATLPCAAVTAWNALVEGALLTPGDHVLLLGTGGVSVFGLQLARLLGLRTIITSSSDVKLERMAQLGADVMVNYAATPDWDRRVLEVTGGRGVDRVLEVGGADTLARSLAATRLGGEVTVIGIVSGEATLNPRLLVGRSQTLRGVWVGNRRMFTDLVEFVDLHGLEPVIDATFEFADAVAAYRHLKAQTHVGKVVVRV